MGLRQQLLIAIGLPFAAMLRSDYHHSFAPGHGRGDPSLWAYLCPEQRCGHITESTGNSIEPKPCAGKETRHRRTPRVQVEVRVCRVCANEVVLAPEATPDKPGDWVCDRRTRVHPALVISVREPGSDSCRDPA